MIKIDKPQTDIPNILNNTSTESKRKRLLQAKKWLSSSSYKSPYQSPVVRKELKEVYNGKCAYCEQRVKLPKKNQSKAFGNDLTIEHYRPKTQYWWLAYSWDNLLPVCYDCNHTKGDDFELNGTKIKNIREGEIDNIHDLAIIYHIEEHPKFPHPEIDDLTFAFTFDKEGNIYSENERCEEVIQKCQLNRSALSRKRIEIINKIKTDFQSIRTKEEFQELIENLKKESNHPKRDFKTLRKFILLNFKELIV